MEFNNLFEAYHTLCGKYAERVLFRNQNITYAEAWQRVQKRAVFLQEKGYKKGDIIAILAGVSVEWCLLYMAITAIGAIALPMDTNLPAAQYRDMVKTAGAAAAFVSRSFSNVFDDFTVFSAEEEPPAANQAEIKVVPASRDDIASLLFTSGTTGNPKIVALTHGNIIHVAQDCTRLEEYTQDDVTLAMLPLYHVYAFESTFMAPLVTGSSIVFLNSMKGPDIIKAMAENPITIFPAAPQMWELFFDGLIAKVRAQSKLKFRMFMFFLNAAPVLSILGLGFILRKVFHPIHDVFGHNMRFFISGGASLKKEYFNYYRRMGFNIMEGYGLTETTGPIAIPYYKDSRPGAVGPPIRGNEVKIKNKKEDGIGEIWLKGPAVMSGYYKNEEANRLAFDDDRFFNTQDLGFVDKRGHIHITGRVKNVIILDSGKNVYPEELELYFRTSPLIAEIAVFGRNIDGRETVYAVIVPAVKGVQNYQGIRDEIIALNKGLPAYKTITRFALSADPLPRNSSRKVLIDEVIRLLDQGVYQTDASGTAVARNILTATTVREEEIILVLAEKLEADVLLANETLADRQIDSLGLVELIVYLEETLHISVDMDKVNTLQTFEEFVRYLAGCEEQSSGNLDETILRGEITTKASVFWNPFTEFIMQLVRVVSSLFWRISTTGKENLHPENAIIVANHQSILDPVLVLNQMPRKLRRDIFFIAKKELSFLSIPFAGAAVLFVDRSGNIVPSLKAAADVLRSGHSLLIFPEGTRTRDGALGKFRSGAAYLAKNLNKKIIPVTIRGAFEIMPAKKHMPRFLGGQKLYVNIGSIINPEDFNTIEELNDHVQGIIEGNM